MSHAPLLSFRAPAPAGTLPVSIDRLIESRLLIQANSGGGKSRALRYLLEQTHGRVQHIVLDREGEFSTLRDKFDYALAGPGGETAADVRSAKLLARRTLEVGFSLIVDLSEMSLASQRQYVKVFLDSLNHLPRDLWKDCLVVIDEAHLFAPESGKGDGTALEAIALLLSTGRKRGFCAVLATQRIAKLSKDVSAECLNKMIGRTSEEDVKRAAEEIGMTRADSKSLRALDPGHFWSYGPAIGTDPVLALTGAVQTSPPKRGALREPAPPTPAAIKRILADLADLPAEAAHEEADVATLRKRVAELERAKLAVAAPVMDDRAIERAVLAATKEQVARFTQLVRTAERFGSALAEIAGKASAAHESLARMLSEIASAPVPAPTLNRGNASSNLAPAAAKATGSSNGRTPQPSTPGVGKTGAKILGALAFYEGLGKSNVPAAWVAAFVGMTSSGGSWGARVSELRQSGYVTAGNGMMSLTDEGRSVADTSGLPRSLDELHDQWRAKLGGKSREMLNVLINAYPNAVTKEDLAAAVEMEMSGGSFGARLSEVRAPGLLDIAVPRGEVRASDVLFPAGLR